MKVQQKVDIEASAEVVFARLSDVEAWERAAMRRGVDLTRTAKLDGPAAVGMAWAARVPFRGKIRDITMSMTRLDPPTALGIEASGALVTAEIEVDVLDLGPRRSRVTLAVTLGAQGLSGKLLLQSLKLARGKIEARMKGQLDALALEIEDRQRRAAGV